MAGRYRVGIDVGGTFTDLVAVEETTGARVALKLPSTPRAPEEAVLAALRRFVDTTVPADRIALVCHSTTVATNALLGQLGLDLPRVGLLTTEGFRDVLEIGRQARAEVYNLFVTRPRPLVERRDRLGVPERVDARGDVLVPLDDEAARQALSALHAAGVRDVAVVFLHSYANPAHERRVAALAAAAYPGLTVTLSSDVDPEYREYERTSTTVVTSALRPIVGGYLSRLATGTRALGIAAPVLVMGSHGGMSDIVAAAARPAALIESGPAGGLAAAADLARALGLERALAFDMGGTTAKAGAVLGGTPQTVAEFEAAGRTHSGRHVRGSGYPVRFPFLDLAEVSAGGGTIAYGDPGSALRVGPLSAGADPGPVCYGRGGTDPTVTDANLLLGRLDAAGLLGGAMAVDSNAAERAMSALAARLGLETLSLAAGIVRLVDADMARALRIVSVERGYDPRRFTMIAFGGGGPLHACALAATLGIPRVVVPTGPGLFSASGLLTSPLKVALMRPVLSEATTADAKALARQFAALEDEARAELARQGAAPAGVLTERTLDLRYAGQSFELSVPTMAALPGETPSQDWLSVAVERFHQRHREVYGYASPGHAVEVVAARLSATAPTGLSVAASAPSHTESGSGFSDVGGRGEPGDMEGGGRRKGVAVSELAARRAVYFEGAGFVPTPVYWRETLSPDAVLEGSAVVQQYDTTTLLHPSWQLEVDIMSNLVLSRVR